MFEKFSDRCRKVMALANQEAQRLNHEYIGTEHLLLGLVVEGTSAAAKVLRDIDVDLHKVRLEVEKLVRTGPDTVSMSKLRQTPRTKEVIEYAIEESRILNYNYVGTEHLLLGLLREENGVHVRVLERLGAVSSLIRSKMLEAIRLDAARAEDPAGSHSDEPAATLPTSPVQPLTLLIDPGSATREDLAELFVELSFLYRLVGGSGITFSFVDAKEGASV